MILREYQKQLVSLVRDKMGQGRKKVIAWLATGGGKCHDGNAKVIMFDGSIKLVKDIKQGDKLMGIDSKPRVVKAICRGISDMYEVTPVKGDKHVFNEHHILTLRASYTGYGYTKGQLVDISIKDYLKSNKTKKHQLKLARSEGIEFPEKEVFNPYLMGLYIGDGTKLSLNINNGDQEIEDYLDQFIKSKTHYPKKNCTEFRFEKEIKEQFKKTLRPDKKRFIPDEYKINSRKNRLKLLAGMLDTDGYYHHGYYEITAKDDTLKEDILYLCRSLGLASYSSIKKVKLKHWDKHRTYHRIKISGDLTDIPIKIKRKKPEPRKQIKSVLNTGFKIEKIEMGKYYGFELDGDHRYLMHDFTITHNSAIMIDLTRKSRIKGKKVCVVVRRKQLVIDTYRKYQAQSIPCGMIMSKDKRRNDALPVQVCSIDTVGRKNADSNFLFDFDLVIVDECHDSMSPKYQEFLSKFKPSTRFVGLTATPFSVAGKALSWWESCVKSIGIRDLINQGNLTDFVVYVPNGGMDLSHIKNVAGDYHQGQLSDEMTNSKIVGDAVYNYEKYGQDHPALAFCVNKKHARIIADEFTQAGYPFEVIDESTKQKDRDKYISQLKAGKIRGISSVVAIATGVDIPEAICALMLRPTRSETLYIQSVGRVLRPYRKCGKCKKQYDNSDKCYHCGWTEPEFIKKNAIIIDYAGCVLEHGLPDKDREPCLTDEDRKKKKEATEAEIKTKSCKKCFATYIGSESKCPYCGHENEKVERIIETVEGELVPYSIISHILSRRDHYTTRAHMKNYSPNWVHFQLYREFGDELYKFKELEFPSWVGSSVKKEKEKQAKIEQYALDLETGKKSIIKGQLFETVRNKEKFRIEDVTEINGEKRIMVDGEWFDQYDLILDMRAKRIRPF